MGSISNFFFLLSLSLSLTLQSQQVFVFANINVAMGIDLITQTCEHSAYKDICFESLKSDPRSQEADLRELASIAINVAASNATNLSYHISELLNKTEDSFIQQCLIDCSDNYMDAIDQLEDSLGALDSKGYNDVILWVQAAMSDAESCEDGFKDQPGHGSVLTHENAVFNKLCSNVIDITNVLAGI